MKFPGAMWLVALLCAGGARAAEDGQLRILVLGSSDAYHAEIAFPPVPIASSLQQILAQDTNLTQSIHVQAQDLFQTNQALSSHSLMSWFYWPDNHANTLALLHEAWDYVVMIDDPHVASVFPEYHLEGVKQVGEAVRQGGGQPLLVMTWSSGAATPLEQFGEMAYRVGAGCGVPVVPAGYAWANVDAADADEGARPTPRGAYVTAAAIYSVLFGRSAKGSGHVPAGTPESVRDALADAAFGAVQAEATNTHYAGAFTGPTSLVAPANKKRYLECADFNSSTETGIWGGLVQVFAMARINAYRHTSGYQTLPAIGHAIDFCQTRFYQVADTTYWRNHACFDYQDDNGTLTMIRSVDEVMHAVPSPEQESDASLARGMLAAGGFFVPVRLMWSRIYTAHPEIPCEPDGHHLSAPYLQGIAAMMYTLLSGRCPVGDEPANPATTEWQNWYCRKTGYEIAWQLATLNSRAPGFVVLPSSASATNLTANAADSLTIRFRHAPTAEVTVAATVSHPDHLILNPARLVFTPQNHMVAQTVSIRGTPGATNGAVNVDFTTASPDPVFNGLSDTWPYRAVGSGPPAGGTTQAGTQAVSVVENTVAEFSLGVAGASAGNTALLAPVHGSLQWAGTNLAYRPATNYQGQDELAYWVTNGAGLTLGAVRFTVRPAPPPSFALTVVTDHGVADPPAGTHETISGAVVTHAISVPGPAGGTQYVCTGWSLAGHEPAGGAGTHFTMTVTNAATLTWLWSTNYWLDTEAGAGGSVTVGDSWQAAGLATQVAAIADPYFHFAHWSGTAAGTQNPLDLLLDAPQTVQAHFAANLAAGNTPEWWLAQNGWSTDFDAAALGDPDEDGYPTWQECIADTDPRGSNSQPRVDIVFTAGAEPVIAWSSSTGRVYQIHRCDDLEGGVWITQQLALGTGIWTDTNPPPATNRYYRIAPQMP